MLKSAETLKPLKDPKACFGTLVILQRSFMEMLAATSATSLCSRRQRRLKRFSNFTAARRLHAKAIDAQWRSNMFICELPVKTNGIALAHSSEDLLLEVAIRSSRALYERGRLSMPPNLIKLGSLPRQKAEKAISKYMTTSASCAAFIFQVAELSLSHFVARSLLRRLSY